MVKGATDLQFSIAERIDSKVRAYFGFATTVYGVVQALVLGLSPNLGSQAHAVRDAAIVATAALLVAMITAVLALRTQDEADVSEENLRELLIETYSGDGQAAGKGINLLIGQLQRRKTANAQRDSRLTVVMWVSAVAAAIAIVEIAIAVEVVTL